MDDTTMPACAEKLSFDTEQAARASAVAVEWQRGTKLKPYHCRLCGLWHLTTRAGED
jgi:hypothetical protein